MADPDTRLVTLLDQMAALGGSRSGAATVVAYAAIWDAHAALFDAYRVSGKASDLGIAVQPPAFVDLPVAAQRAFIVGGVGPFDALADLMLQISLRTMGLS